jgi:hypothetical protein
MEIDTAASEASGMRGPSPRFIQGRHERMRSRLNSPMSSVDDISKKLSTEGCNETSKEKKQPKENIPKASPTAILSIHQLRSIRKTPKSRVPGGAAAKLIGKAACDDNSTPMDKEEEEEREDMPSITPASEDELERARDEAKSLFEKGPKENRRYHQVEKAASDVSNTKATPVASRFLNRAEVLPVNPTEAVLSLIGKKGVASPISTTRKRFPGDISISTSRSREQVTSVVRDFTKTPAIEMSPRKVFEAPSRNADEVLTSVLSDDIEATAMGTNPLEQPLLSKKTEQRVAQMKEQMQDPNPTLASLIATIATPEDHSSKEGFSRGSMVRRKNACGALQVLTTKQHKRVSICWTLGVLAALSSVLDDSGTIDLDVEFPDVATRKEFQEARKRAVGALLNLSMPPQNRLAVFHTPGMVANIVRVIRLDQAEARKGCCGVLSNLAKAKENRLLMVQVPDLIDTITEVIEPKVIITTQAPIEESDDDDSSRTPDHELLHSSSENSSENDTGSEPFSSASFDSNDEDAKKGGNAAGHSAEFSAVPTYDPVKAARRYDEDPNGNLKDSRMSVFALLAQLVKEKDNAFILARHKLLIDTLVEISKLQDSPAHEHAIKLLAHLTRHRGNSKHFVFKARKIIPALVNATFSSNDETRKYACFALQNFSQDKPCRQELAITDGLLAALCVRVRQASDAEERLSAVQALTNLTNEPANLIPMTNTPECLATLMQIAHAGDDSVTEMMQFLACDALATLSHWFRSIATSGKLIDQNSMGAGAGSDLFVPSLKIVAYEQWQ